VRKSEWREAALGETLIRGVLLDKDGTLFDFGATWRGMAEEVLRALAPDDPALQVRMGAAVGFDMVTGAFAPGSPLVAGATREVAEILAAMAPGLTPAQLEAAANASAERASPAPAAPDLPGLLDGLRAEGRHLGVATHDAESSARKHLEAVGALDRFAFIAGYDSGHGLKPGPGMVLAFAECVGVEPEGLAMVGDSVHDLAAAQAAGAALAIGVLTGPADEADLAPFADVVLPSIAALPGWLAERGY
jgi:phosphoglycolate phosphatase